MFIVEENVISVWDIYIFSAHLLIDEENEPCIDERVQ